MCYTGSILTPILLKLVEFLGHEIVQSALKETWKIFNEWLEKKYGGWNEILKTAFDKGEQPAISALEAAKDEIVGICKENSKLLEQLAKVTTKACLSSVGTKQALKAAANLSVQEGTKQAAKIVAAQATKSATKEVIKATTIEGTKQTVIQATKLVAAQSTKSVTKSLKSAANPLSLGADLTQAGLEVAGYKEAGKVVGVTGNIAAGALAGSVFGPPGAVLGALGGFAIWGAGEVVGGLVDRAFGTTSSQKEDLEQTTADHAF